MLQKKTRGEVVHVSVSLRYGGLESLRGFEEAADFLRVSPITVRAMLAEQRMPGKRIGKEWRLSRTALIQWLSEPGERKNYPKRRPVGM